MTLLQILAAIWLVSAILVLAMIAFAPRDPFDVLGDDRADPVQSPDKTP